jgi:hypothetical protein
MRLPAVLILLILACSSPLSAALRATADDYQALQQWRYRKETVNVPAEGLRWSFAGASWELQSGKLWLAEPTADGTVTGIVFEGKGRFHMDVPDPVEKRQLRRFAKKPDLEAVDEPFSSFVLRMAGDVPVPTVPPLTNAPASGFTVQSLARDRHMQWLTERLDDEDARILAALDTPGDRVLRVEMKTDSFGWLTWDFDGRRMEPVRLISFNTTFPAQEVWVSLDPQGRDPENRRRIDRDWTPAVDIEHVDIAVDLTKNGREKDWVAAQFKTAVRFTARPGGTQAVQLFLNPLAKVAAVSENGRPVPFVRDATGKRSRTMDDRIYDNSLLVLLDEPIRAGQPRTLDVEYEIQITNFVPGRDWYPATEQDETFLRDLHTARLTLTTTDKQEVRASGRKEESPAGNQSNRITSVWTVDQPAKIVTFALAKNIRENFHEESYQADGVPEVIVFGPRVGLGTKGKFADVARQVAESVAFFQQLTEQKLTTPTLRVTGIEATHGQSFEGFLQLSSRSLALHGPGAGELFRAHEVAHQWWGHLVGPATYRDAWLSESFSEYSAMMFVEATMKDGDKIFREILRADSDELTGSLQSGYSEFSNPAINLLNRSKGDRIGPLGLGWRASPGELPSAYSSLVYSKGPLVLHMLRNVIQSMVQDSHNIDEPFLSILRDFARTYRGTYASTQDFAAIVDRYLPGDMTWFFDQWVDGTAIPSYRWSYTVAPSAGGGTTLNLKVRQSEVPEGFRMPVPIMIEYADGMKDRRFVMVSKAEETFPLALPRAPKEVVFDPDVAVLARVKKESF